jgi:3-(3-hydroxy-phenyl)propionate hydroxylase
MRATDFITPKSEISRIFQDATLNLAAKLPFARSLVNSGRLSKPCTYDGSPLNGSDEPSLPRRTRPGAPMDDAPLNEGWLLRRFQNGFKLLAIDVEVPDQIEESGLSIEGVHLSSQGHPELRERYLGKESAAVYLIRPDQHVAARWLSFDENKVRRALRVAIGVREDGR